MDMEKEKQINRKRMTAMIISILGLIGIAFGVSYAWFALTLQGTKNQVLRAGKLELILDESLSEGINLDNTKPITDAAGIKT